MKEIDMLGFNLAEQKRTVFYSWQTYNNKIMKKLTNFILISLVILISCMHKTMNKTNKNDAKQYVFDGFKLGDNYGEIMKRPPYNQLCDNDPIDNRNRRFMCYGGLICRNHPFPNETTVMFYLKYSDENKYNQPIEAFGYLYGSYFNDKTNFPLKPGDDLRLAHKKFGKEINTFNISKKEYTLKVYLFNGDIYLICNQKKIVGFVLGKMPSDPINEQWRGLMQMYQRYTPKE